MGGDKFVIETSKFVVKLAIPLGLQCRPATCLLFGRTTFGRVALDTDELLVELYYARARGGTGNEYPVRRGAPAEPDRPDALADSQVHLPVKGRPLRLHRVKECA